MQNCWMSKTQSSNLPCFALWPLNIDDVMMHARKETQKNRSKVAQLNYIEQKVYLPLSLSLSLALLLNQALTRHTWGFTLWIHLYGATRPNPPDPSYLEKQTVKTTPSLLFYNFHLHERSLQLVPITSKCFKKISPFSALNW